MKQVLKELPCTVQKGWFKPYSYAITCDGITHHVYLVPTHKGQLVTINSKYIWNIKTGKIDGARFTTSHVKVLELQAFLKLENPIIVLKKPPYKVLKYINESEVDDITTSLDAFGLTILPNTQKLLTYLKQTR